MPAVRRRRLGAVRARTTGRRRTTSRPSSPSKLARAAAAVPDRGGEVQRPAARRPARRALQPRPGRAGRSSSAATSQLLFGGMGRLSENSVVVHQEQVARGHRRRSTCPTAGANGVIIAQGGAFGGLEPVRQGRQAGLLLQPVRPAAVQGLRRRRRSRRRAPGADGVRLRRRRARQGRRRRRSTSTARKVGEGRVDAHRADALLRRRDDRRRQRQRDAGERRLRPERQRVHRPRAAGCRSTSTRTPRTPTT